MKVDKNEYMTLGGGVYWRF